MTEKNRNLLVDTDGDGVTTVTIHRPDKLNALDKRLLNDLEVLFADMAGDDKVRGVILTGAGDQAFAAGADIRELQSLNRQSGAGAARRGQAVFSGIESFAKPVIALVNGYALGGGAELALACHLRYATVKAVFGFPEVSLGVIPGYGGTQRLTRLVGPSRALEMILTGRQVNAGEAEEVGLVNRIIREEEPVAYVKNIMDRILKNGPLAVSNAIRAVYAAGSPEGYEREAALFGQLCGTEDFKEGVSAFLGKRPPQFRGK